LGAQGGSEVTDIVTVMPITTRRAALGDAAELHALAARTFALACPPGTLPADIDAFIATNLSEAKFENYLEDDNRIILVAPGETPAGYSMLVRGPIADPDVRAVVPAEDTIELSKFYLLADQHGSGIAAALMQATLAAAGATGATTCWLGVNQQNVRAAKFYAKHGFAIVGTKRFLVGDQWHDDHVRVRSL
jgi:ribosomal protein S18 acetylase RimI-like enzyme